MIYGLKKPQRTQEYFKLLRNIESEKNSLQYLINQQIHFGKKPEPDKTLVIKEL